MSNTEPQKVRVIEVDATKLDPNSKYLIVFNSQLLAHERMVAVAKQLDKLGIKAAYTEASDPEYALKVYEIPTPKDTLTFSDEKQYLADLHTPEGRELYRKYGEVMPKEDTNSYGN